MPGTDSIATGLAFREVELPNMRGDAAVYRLEPPFEDHSHVVVSAVDLNFGGFSMSGYRTSETMIFPSDGSKVEDYGELAMVEYKSHSDALAQIGYKVSA